MCMTSIEAFAQQEVRGISTRRVTYNGNQYKYYTSSSNPYRSHDTHTSSQYYGWELTNHNSITVTVDVELYKKGDEDKIVKTQSVILASNEKYIFKAEEYEFVRANFESYEFFPYSYISKYYITYKAYKLE